MPASAANDRGSFALCVLVLVALSLPYCLHLGGSALWDPEEAVSAEIPREMMQAGGILSPLFNFHSVSTEPPLAHWAIFASYGVFGVRELSVRIPGLLAAVGTLLFVFATARRLFSPQAGLLAAAICSTTPRFLVVTRTLPADALLLLWLTGSAYFAVRSADTEMRSDRLVLFVFAALGFLTSGPVAVIIPLGACLLAALTSRRCRIGALDLAFGAALFLVVVLPVLGAVWWIHGWEGLGSVLRLQPPPRHISLPSASDRGLLYFFPVYLADFFPWSLLSLASLIVVWGPRRFRVPAHGLRFPLAWGMLVFVLFSLMPDRQEHRIAPIYPMAAVFLSGVLERVRLNTLAENSAGHARKRSGAALAHLWSWVVGLAALALLAISLATVFTFRAVIPGLPGVIHYSAPAVLLLGALAIATSMTRIRLHRCILILAGALWMVFLLVPLVYLPAVEPFRPVRDLCGAIRPRLQPGDEAGYYRALVPSMVYYLRRPIYEESDADAMVTRFRSPRRVFCIMTEQDENFFVGSKDLILYIIDRRPRLVTRLRGLFDQSNWAQQELLLVSNRPPEEPAVPGGPGEQ